MEEKKSDLLTIRKYYTGKLIINDSIDEAAKRFVIVAKAARLKQSKEEEKEFVRQWLVNN